MATKSSNPAYAPTTKFVEQALKGIEFIAVYSKDCFECGHLRSDSTKFFKACHFSQGNDFCPAAGVRLVTVGEAYRLAKQVHAARDVRDAQEEAKLLRKAAALDEHARERFYAAVEDRKLIEKFANGN
jgi:hypothetical protein